MKTKAAFAIVAMLVILPLTPVMADYTDPPEWETSPCYTHQSWELNSDTDEQPEWNEELEEWVPAPVKPQLPYGPDALEPIQAWSNPHGTPELYAIDSDVAGETGSECQWSWEPMGGPWFRHGQYVGMADSYLFFRIPTDPDAEKTSLWIQYVVYVPSAYTPETNVVTALTDDEHIVGVHLPNEPGGEPIGTLVAREYNERPWEEGGGCTGKWWRVTELWEVYNPLPDIYISLFIYKGFYGTATACDAFDVDTRSGGQLKISLSENNNPLLDWYALVGKQYTVQYSDDEEGPWNDLLGEPLEVTNNGNVDVEDTSPISIKRLYRLLIEDISE